MSVSSKAVRGMAWTVSTSMASRAVSLVGTLVLVHYMEPNEYGAAMAAWVLVATAQQFSTLGVGMFLVKNPRAGRDIAFHATAIHMALGVVAIGTVVALRGPLGPLFDAPTLGRFVPLLAVATLLDRIGFMPEKVLVSQLRFRALSIARTACEIAYTGVSVLLAMRGYGAWAIVWGNVARSLVRLCLVTSTVSWRDWCEPHRLRKETLRTLIGFGAIVALGGIAAFASRRWDNLLVTRLFGLDIAGAYVLAYNLADVPAVQVGEQITDVLVAALAHMEAEERKRALVRTVGLLALIMFPMAAGLGSVAPAVAHTFLTRAWEGVAPMLMILACLSAPRPITLAFSGYLLIRDKAHVGVGLECANVAVLLTLIATLGRVSPYLACSAVGISFTLRALATMWAVARLEGTTFWAYLRPMIGPVLACAPMIGAVIGVRYLLADVRPAVLLVVQMLVGAAVYVGAALVLARDSSRELLRLVGGVIRKRRAE